ncbi:transmembrane protein [Ceratobasidium theobromae]|uniref:Transmembrane protein n=1 Tax=Ceratobasidium theobromae TaxID=1582974 RepID=A0A5N5QR58_9AGAM|nr:transmembrane protein [Ceratobasidium theobromae]
MPERVGITRSTQVEWFVNVTAGTQIWFQVFDANWQSAYTHVVSVLESTNVGCLKATEPSAITTPSLTISLASQSALLPSSSVTAKGTAISEKPALNKIAGALAGGVIGGAIALLLLLLLLVWFRRRYRAFTAASYPQSGWSSNPESYNLALQSSSRASQLQALNESHPASPRTDLMPPNSSIAHPNDTPSGPSAILPRVPSLDVDPTGSTLNEPAPAIPLQPPGKYAQGEDRFTRLVREVDAEISLVNGLCSSEYTSLPPAYNNAWRSRI